MADYVRRGHTSRWLSRLADLPFLDRMWRWLRRTERAVTPDWPM